MDGQTVDYSQIGITIEEKDKLVAKVMRYVLFKTHQNSGCPIKREELTQLITKNYNQKSLPALVINEAREKMSSVFGYEMKELARHRSLSNKKNHQQQAGVDAKSYIIVSQLPTEIYSQFVENKEDSPSMAYTFVVIAVVYLAGGKISEDNLYHHLRRLGIAENDESHPLFSNPKERLEELVQQRYLLKDKVTGPDGAAVMYELAEKALDESVSARVKQYISEIVSKDANAEED